LKKQGFETKTFLKSSPEVQKKFIYNKIKKTQCPQRWNRVLFVVLEEDLNKSNQVSTSSKVLEITGWIYGQMK
jgi:hypothetical protein